MLDSLISNPSNASDEFCNLCIYFLSQASKFLGISYGELNVFLFVILLPSLVLYYAILSWIGLKKLKYKIIFILSPIIILLAIGIYIFINTPL